MEKIQKDGLPGHKYYMEVAKVIHQCENCTDEKAANVYRDKEFITKCALTALEIYNNEYSDEKRTFKLLTISDNLQRMAMNLPLSNIVDRDFIDVEGTIVEDKGYTVYQHPVMKYFEKRVYNDGTIKYRDNRRIQTIAENMPFFGESFEYLDEMFDELFPINLPYFVDIKHYYVYYDGFKLDKSNNFYYDVHHVKHIITNNKKILHVDKCYQFKYDKWVEITKEEFNQLKGLKQW
jgi:hypothetical protein